MSSSSAAGSGGRSKPIAQARKLWVQETEHRQSRGSGERTADATYRRNSRRARCRHFFHPSQGSRTDDNFSPQLALWAWFFSLLPRLQKFSRGHLT
jgi:hypothetical protein